MDFGVVQPASRQGAWEVEGFGYATNAKTCLRQYEEKREQLNEELDRQVEARKEGRPYTFPHGLSDEYRLFRTATVMFAAMAVETFLNLYGVKRLGEAFYRETLERLTPTHRKVSALIATCCGKLLPNDAELLAVTKRLAAARNRLAHPKAREAIRRRKSLPPPKRAAGIIDLPAASVRDMERFFELFGELDPQAAGVMPW